MSKACQIGLIQGGQMMDMTQNYSLWPHKGNFPGKTKNNRSICICSKYNLSTLLLSTLMTYVKNMSNWPDPGGQMMDMTQNDSLWPLKGNFPGKTKNNRSIWICLKYNLSSSLLSTLITYLKNILNGPGLIQGVKWWIWPKIIHFDRIRVIFLEKLKRTEAYDYA